MMSEKIYRQGYHDGAMNETKGKKAKIVKLEDEIAKLKATIDVAIDVLIECKKLMPERAHAIVDDSVHRLRKAAKPPTPDAGSLQRWLNDEAAKDVA